MSSTPQERENGGGTDKLRLSEEEWRSRLTPLQYRVTREAGTEPPFDNEYWRTDVPGAYVCVCCDTPLFTSGEKFHSACGWPAFSAAREGVVEEHEDQSHGMVRTEVRCRRCDAHLGHVFNDGPPPSGLRYCINSAAVRLEPDGAAEG